MVIWQQLTKPGCPGPPPAQPRQISPEPGHRFTLAKVSLAARTIIGRKEAAVEFEHVLVDRSGDFATITMNRPARRNALSLQHMRELIEAFSQVGSSDA